MIYQGISVFTGQAVEIEVRDQRIQRVRRLEAQGPLPHLSPGFLDLQVNGYLGADYSLDGLTEDQVTRIVSSLDPSGTTQHVPTIVTSPKDRLIRNLKVICRAMQRSEDIARAIAGIHIEGPFISRENGPRGAHDPAYVRAPDLEEYKAWQEAAEGRIRIITLAPEWDGALRFIEKVSGEGVIVALGHTGAAPERIREAVAAGARLSTHLGNGSHAQVPRLKNYIWEQLAEDSLRAGIICDGFHLPPSVIKVFTRAKGLERLILVSDVAYLGGMEPGVYNWGSIRVQVHEDGHLGLAGTEFLAGAGHLLDWDIPRFMEAAGRGLAEAIPLCTGNPARLLQLPEKAGSLEPGAPADLVLFDYTMRDARLRVLKTIRAGREVFSQGVDGR